MVSCARIVAGNATIAVASRFKAVILRMVFFIGILWLLVRFERRLKIEMGSEQFNQFYHAPSVISSVMFRARSSASNGDACRSADARSVPTVTSV